MDNNMMQVWTKQFKDEEMLVTKGDNAGKHGTFVKVTGYISARGAVVAIELDSGEMVELTSDFFDFTNPATQANWDSDLNFG